MNTSETISAIATALAAAQAELTDPVKDRVNSHLKSRYVNITDGLAVARPVLSKHGIAFVQATSIRDGVIVLTTRLVHKSGEWMSGDYPVCNIGGKDTDMGAALTYSRRFSLFSLIGIAGADDDMDGTDAAPPPQGYRKQDSKPEKQRQSGPSAAELERADYIARAKTAIANCATQAEVEALWNAESKNRELHFSSTADAGYQEIRKALLAHLDAISPKKDAAE